MIDSSNTKEEDKKLVSIIIPAHQAESFIERSVKSALTQTYKSVEVIVIENGSTDKTQDVVSKIKDDRLIMIQSEKGVSNARNAGLRKMRGEFVLFLDADDWLANDAVEELLSVMEDDVDLVSARYYGDKPFERYHHHKYEAGSEEYIIKCLCTPTKRGNCTGNLYRTRVIKEHEIYFDPNLSHAEDSVWFISLMLKNIRACDYEHSVYHVFTNPESATRKIGSCDFIDFQIAIDKVYAMLDQRSQSVINAGYIFCLNQLLVILVHSVSKMKGYKGLQEIKKITREDVFKRALNNAEFSNISLEKRMLFLFLKHKVYFPVYIASKVRAHNNNKKIQD